MPTKKKNFFLKNLPNVLLLVTINVVLVILVASLFISRFGVASLLSIISPYDKIDAEVIEKGDVESLRDAREKINEFNNSQIEKVELVLTEAETNALLREFVLRKALETKADMPSEEILQEKGLKAYTQSQEQVLFAKVLVNLNSRDSADFWVSFDHGEKWMVFKITSELGDEGLYLEAVHTDTILPHFMEEPVQDEVNIAIKDAIYDFNEKHIVGRKITNIEFREGRILITGEKKDL